MQQNPIQERFHFNREPLDEWSVREKMSLAFAVAKIGDQNWMSVSRALKPHAEPNRPADWFHQKNCAAQYCALLSSLETPKRKSRGGNNGDALVETPIESITKKLVAERKAELLKLMAQEKVEYKQVHEDIKLLQSGQATEEQIDKWDKEIDEEEVKRTQDLATHAKWLKQRETKNQEIEKVFKSIKTPFSVGQKRKVPEDFEDNREDTVDEKEATIKPPATTTAPQQQKSFNFEVQKLNIPQPEPTKPALSPLLTSLLKSPSQVQNIASTSSSSILHSVITNSSKMAENSPAITSLLNTTTPNIAAVQFAVPNKIPEDPATNQPLDLMDDANIKIDDLAKSILDDSPLPEIKKDEVDDIISEIIENHDIVDDPEKHLQLDKNGDININLEIDDVEINQPEPVVEVKKQIEIKKEKPAPVVDPFEFQEDPVIFESPVKPSTLKQEYVPLYQQSPIKTEDKKNIEVAENPKDVEVKTENKEVTNKKQIPEVAPNVDEIKHETVVDNTEIDAKESPPDEKVKIENIKTSPDNLEQKEDCSETNTTTVKQSENISSFSDDLYDDNIKMEVKIDKTGGTKRDYSRPKKKEDKSYDLLLLTMEKGNSDPTLSDDGQKRSIKTRLKSDSERSFSPWTEDEDSHSKPPKAETPIIDSFPNSPASHEDDKDHRNVKKSMMIVYKRLASNRFASVFRKPITDEQAPCYSNLIYKPMDLLTIKKNIDNGVIRTSLQLKRDIMLMFQNAIMYNKTDGTVYNMALQMQQESLEPIECLLQAEGKIEAPARRETRTSESGLKRKARFPDEGGKKRKRDD